MQFTKDLFKSRISAGLPSSLSGEFNGSAPGNLDRKFPTVDLGALVHIPEDDSFIRESYRRVLNRECDPGSFINCLEMLRRHTPRRILLQQLIQSEEAQRRGISFEGLPEQPVSPPERRSPFAGPRRLAFKAYDFVRRAWHAPFLSLDQKLTLILRELSSRIDDLKEKSDRSLWTLSEKLDACGVGINASQHHAANIDDRLARIDERTAALEERALLVSAQSESHNTALSGITACLSTLSAEVSRLASHRQQPILLGGNNIFITELDGFIIGQPGEEWRMAAFHALRGVMEPGLVRRLQQLLQPGMTFVDIGANIGVMTLHAAVRVAPNGKVHSFEPAPRTFQILKDNIQVNGLLESGLIELHCAAVSDAVGVAKLSIYPDDSGHNTLFGSESDSRVAVNTITLDSLLAQARVDVVKIDAEGAEPMILRGMRNVLHANPQLVVLMEFAPTHLRRSGVAPATFLEELQSSGFVIRVIDDVTGEPRETDLPRLAEVFSVNLELTRNK
ncbi:MAG TPA: FkbM family methyltransferase [Bryobacteraceae bacterium]|nr:FkbM family methyltransferase [Bryobacteraceae bacterium]